MDINRKVVWAEGVFLGQQHFQQWELGLTAGQQLKEKFLIKPLHGIGQLVLNKGQLEFNKCQVDQLIARMPDGRWLKYDVEVDHYPLQLDLSQAEESVYVVLPKEELIAGMSGYPSVNQETAWQAKYQTCVDLYDKSRKTEVMFAHQKAYLTTNPISSNLHATLKLFEFKKEGGNGYDQKDYIPALLSMRSSNLLVSLSQQIQQKLKTAIEQLNKHRLAQGDGTDSVDWALISSTILARHYMTLKLYQQGIEDNPQHYVSILVCLLGELKNLVGEELDDLPDYDHDALYPLLMTLQDILVDLLKQIQPKARTNYQLIKQSENLFCWHGVVDLNAENEQLYLEVRTGPVKDDVLTTLQKAIKIGPATKINQIYTSAITAIGLSHCTRVPSRLQVEPGCEYFEIQMQGSYWQMALDEGVLAIRMPEAFSSYPIRMVKV